jgi:hypothetical protein
MWILHWKTDAWPVRTLALSNRPLRGPAAAFIWEALTNGPWSHVTRLSLTVDQYREWQAPDVGVDMDGKPCIAVHITHIDLDIHNDDKVVDTGRLLYLCPALVTITLLHTPSTSDNHRRWTATLQSLYPHLVIQ